MKIRFNHCNTLMMAQLDMELRQVINDDESVYEGEPEFHLEGVTLLLELKFLSEHMRERILETVQEVCSGHSRVRFQEVYE